MEFLCGGNARNTGKVTGGGGEGKFAVRLGPCDKLKLLFVSTSTTETITSIVSFKDFTFTACGAVVIKFRRAREVQQFSIPDLSDDARKNLRITQLIILGDYVIGLASDNVVRAWRTDSGELDSSWDLGSDFTGILLLHPPTFVNKVLVVGADAMSSTPVADIVAIGHLDGAIDLLDIRSDQRLMTLYQDDKVSSIAFRTDGPTIMATGNTKGDICLWDLEKRRIVSVMKGAHNGHVSSIYFFQGQPLMLTASPDNSVKEWLFDSPDGVPRLLRFREGHSSSPTRVRFHGASGKTLLSAARDRSIRLVSVIRDAQSVELSQGKGLEAVSQKRDLRLQELKLPIVTAIASRETRQGDWDNIVTAHLNDSSARTWDAQRKALGKHTLPTTDGKPVSCVAISTCGNFGFVGSVGVASDPINRTVISSSSDATARFWDFESGGLLDTLQLPCSASSLYLTATSTLCALVMEDWSIIVVDVDSRRIVRTFVGHTGAITDIAFTPNNRWLVSSSADSTIRTWDLPSGLCVDVFGVESVATSLSISPTGEWLATSHIDNVGVFLWSNVSQWTSIFGVDEQAAHYPTLSLPTAADVEEVNDTDDLQEWKDDSEAPESTKLIVNVDSLADDTVRLSLVPKSRWQTLLNLDTIKARNKPVQKVTKPEKVPFFLPTIAGAQPKLNPLSEIKKDNEIAQAKPYEGSRTAVPSSATGLSTMLRKCNLTGDFAPLFEEMTTWSASALDFHLRALSSTPDFFASVPDDEESDLEILTKALRWCLSNKKDFEFVEALLALTLRIHGDVLAMGSRTEDSRGDALDAILPLHIGTWQRLDQLFSYADCLANFIRSSA
ncbi:hypothetical protein HDU93_009116 [Gonapodya sp. JEL0774]|nr:hypothetical protein HDU93_009116 [Gonapodya sp. JEL0774]